MLRTNFLCFSFFILGIKANRAPFIKPCTWQDSDCILKSSKIALPYLSDGVPDLGLPPSDPLGPLDPVNADNGALKLMFNDVIVKGVKKCTFIKITRHVEGENSTGSMTVDCPITMTGQYKMDGKILFVNAVGNGPFEIKTDKIRLKIDLSLKSFKGKDGKKYYKVGSFQYEYEPVERIYMDLDNLSNGEKSQGEALLNLMNENWKDMVANLGKPLFEACLKELVQNLDLFFRGIPCEELEIV